MPHKPWYSRTIVLPPELPQFSLTHAGDRLGHADHIAVLRDDELETPQHAVEVSGCQAWRTWTKCKTELQGDTRLQRVSHPPGLYLATLRHVWHFGGNSAMRSAVVSRGQSCRAHTGKGLQIGEQVAAQRPLRSGRHLVLEVAQLWGDVHWVADVICVNTLR